MYITNNKYSFLLFLFLKHPMVTGYILLIRNNIHVIFRWLLVRLHL